MSRLQADGWLLVVVLIWGSTFVIVKNSLASVGPFVFIASRFWIAAGVLLVGWLLRRSRVSGELVRDGVITGLLLWFGFVTQTIGLSTTEASKAAFITGLNVVLVPLFAGVLLRQPPTRAAVLGVGLATVGLAVMTLDVSLGLAVGDAWVLACAVGFALHIVAISHYVPRYPALAFTLVQLLTVASLSTVAALVLERGALVPPANTLPAVLYMGLVATAVVFGLQTWAQRYTTATHTALIFALEPVFAAIFAMLVANEVLEAREWIGGGLILLGMLAAELGDSVWGGTAEVVAADG
jgi:drug/metabolite transporter (DMT)-like permease